MSNDYWEPWQPKIGDRVRVKINPECPWCQENRPTHNRAVDLLEPRDQRTGVVHRIGADVGFDQHGHTYDIRWDEPIPAYIGPGYLSVSMGGYFAAVELRPL